MVRTSVGAALAATLLAPSVAEACGGFFCSSARPVDQAAEEVVFAVADGTVTMHVKIAYTGEAEDFAWVVPVPQVPDLEIGTDALFPILSQLRARWNLARDLGDCDLDLAVPSAGGDDDDGRGEGVEVVSTGVVGPYETAVLQATDSGELLEWLGDNGYDLPADLDGALAPYVADGMYFVALKLAKDEDVGDLEPIVLTYPGTQPAIPIQLTSIAATEDMRLRVYLLGEHRAVPESYLHLVLNELAIDWWTGGANVEAVITRAANEAGGHGFFTDYAGSTEPIRGQLWTAAWDRIDDDLLAVADATGVFEVLVASGLPFDDAVLGVLSDHLDLPRESSAGLDLLDVLGCLAPYGYYYGYGGYGGDCYVEELAAIEVDGAALAADFEAQVLEPRRRTEAMLGAHPRITRLTSDVSPIEMTVDPTFVFNADLRDVELQRDATEEYDCGAGADLFEAPRRLRLSDGRVVPLPSIDELAELGLTEIQWLEQRGLTTPANARIERTGASGEPEVLTDNAGLLQTQLDALGGLVKGDGCGCGSHGSGAAGLVGVGLALLLRRRGVAL